MTPGRRHKGGESFHEGQLGEAYAVGAVLPGALEFVDHIPFGGQVEAGCGDWRAGDIAANLLHPIGALWAEGGAHV